MALPDDVDPRMLDPESRRELRTLSRETSDLVARHLVMTGRLLDDDPSGALAHARAARALAGRVGVVREAVGLAAYSAGEWAEALSELRAARRITGLPEHLAVAADCERALGRSERALVYADDPDVPRLAQEQRVELIIVLAGARRDLDQHEAAVLVLQDPARRTTAKRPWAARLWYAYADALLAADRPGEAKVWFGRAADVDVEGATDAGDRLLELDGIVLEDLDDDDDMGADLLTAEELEAYVKDIPVPASPQGPEGASQSAAPPVPDVESQGLPDGDPPAQRDSTGDTGTEHRDSPADAERVSPPSGVAPPSFLAAPVHEDAEDDLRPLD